MEATTRAIEAAVEADHWWFRGRRRLLGSVIRDLALAPDARTLDVGSGSGANLRLLAELGLGRARGLDRSAEAVRLCRAKGLPPVERGDARALPFADASFGLVLAADVLEHVADDAAAAAELARVLAPGGHLVATVPAFPSLWGLQDEVSHHHRRYRRAGLEALLAGAKLELVRSFHFNYLLFAPIWLARQAIRILRLELASENELNAPLLNAVLERIFALDVATAPWLRPPFGVSILAVARRPEA